MTTHVARDGQVFGTFEDEDLKDAIAAGTVQLSDLGWREGMAGWCSIAELLPAETSPSQESALDTPAATIPPNSETPPAQPATEEELAFIQQLDGQPPTRISDDEAVVVFHERLDDPGKAQEPGPATTEQVAFIRDVGGDPHPEIAEKAASAKNMTTVARDGQVFGTFEDEDLKDAIAAGTVQLSDLGWREGMAGWCSIAELLPAETLPSQESALDTPAATIPPDSETPRALPTTEKLLVFIQRLGGRLATGIGEDEAAVTAHRRRIARVLFALGALALFVTLAWVIQGKLREEVWASFTDNAGTKVGVEEEKARRVLWEDPKPNNFTEQRDPQAPAVADPVNQPGGRVEAAFSPDGTMMVLVRWDEAAGKNAELYLARWDGRVWSRPEPVAAINSPANERGPAFSQDGRTLFFASDRAGGAGGYDLYAARWDGKAWAGVESLGQPLNTAAAELGPAPSADGTRLFFTSDRNGKREDIFVARALPAEPVPAPAPDPKADPKAPAKPVLPPLPKFAAAEPVGALNSTADDAEAALTRRGDHVFLASDRDRKDATGFGIYLSRVVAGETQSPEKVDLYFKAGDTTDPAVRMDGFDLLFSAKLPDAGALPEKNYRLYRSTTREVFGYTDYSRWEQFKTLLGNILWRLLLALAALIALIYLLERWRDLTSLYHKCLAGSAAIHLLILFLMMIWFIAQEVQPGGEPQSPEISVSIDALAQEKLALESTPEEVKMADTPVALVTDKLESDFKIPRSEPQQETRATPIVASTAQDSLITDIRPSKANTAADTPAPVPPQDLPLLSALPATVLPDLETPKLEESNPAEQQKAAEKANPRADAFVPTEALPQVSTAKLAQNATPTDAPAQEQTKATEVKTAVVAAQTADASGDTVAPPRALEAVGTPAELGSAAAIAPNLPSTAARSDDLLPGQLEVQPSAAGQAKPLAESFAPTGAIPQVSTGKLATSAKPANAPAQEPTKATEVKTSGTAVQTKDTGGDTVAAHRGLEASGTPPKLEGTGTLATMLLKLPGTDSRADPLLPGKLEMPKQGGKPSRQTIEQRGGSDATERSINLALEWLARNQEPEGRWDTRKHGGDAEYDTASTGLALLCLYGWGASHTTDGRYRDNVRKGIAWLVAQQKPNGYLAGPAGRMYAHGIATIALCEGYGLSRDPALQAPAEKAIALIVSSQGAKGGWRYAPAPGDSDTSVTGWQYMALHSARMAGLDVPEAVFEKARKWLDFAGGGKHGGLYGYTGPERNNAAMIASGMFCRQLDLVPPTNPRMIESAEALKMHPMNVRSPEFYGLYYATLALYQHQGPIWTEWNDKLKEALPLLQKKDGDAAGSWDPTGGHTGAGGRVLSTTLSTLSLEVYYRLLPMYGFGNKDLPPPKQKDEIPKKP